MHTNLALLRTYWKSFMKYTWHYWNVISTDLPSCIGYMKLIRANINDEFDGRWGIFLPYLRLNVDQILLPFVLKKKNLSSLWKRQQIQQRLSMDKSIRKWEMGKCAWESRAESWDWGSLLVENTNQHWTRILMYIS